VEQDRTVLVPHGLAESPMNTEYRQCDCQECQEFWDDDYSDASWNNDAFWSTDDDAASWSSDDTESAVSPNENAVE